MGVYIKGMEIPTRCEKCRCCKPYEKGIYCTLTVTPVLGNGNARLDNCPLVPVPPHGRLIDADALIKKIAKNMNAAKMADKYVWWNACSVAEDFVMDATTVIPAEEGE